jgi:hypothetical protein
MKYAIFIGSSSENIKIAEAVQHNLHYSDELLPICWNQGVFKISNYPLEDLFRQLHLSAFGIFILADDDKTYIRRKKYATVRDNVLFEMGLFMGALGKDRTCFFVPRNNAIKFRIPSDLEGLNYAKYDSSLLNQNIAAMVAPGCTEIKEKIENNLYNPSLNISIEKYGSFPEFDILYPNLFKVSNKITTSFIHSRRWRENNLDSIEQFFDKNGTEWNVILPNIENKLLLDHLKLHFNDGLTLESKIIDAYDFFLKIQKKYPKKLFIRLYNLYPTYTLYRFDNTLIISLYPLTSERHPTPTFMLNANAINADFFQKDINKILTDTLPIETYKLEKILSLHSIGSS